MLIQTCILYPQVKQLHFSFSHVSNYFISHISLELHLDISVHDEICHLSLYYPFFLCILFHCCFAFSNGIESVTKGKS